MKNFKETDFNGGFYNVLKGETLADLEKVAWCKTTAGQKIHEVGMKEPNSWGLYDMHGNVAEWTLDKITKITSAPLWDPVGPMQDEADTGNDGDYKNKVMGACGGGQWRTNGVIDDELWLSDKCTSASCTPLRTGDGACAGRLTIVME